MSTLTSYRDGSLGVASTKARNDGTLGGHLFQDSSTAFQDGSLGCSLGCHSSAYQDGSLGQAGAFRYGSLGRLRAYRNGSLGESEKEMSTPLFMMIMMGAGILAFGAYLQAQSMAIGVSKKLKSKK